MSSQEQQLPLPPISEQELRQELHVRLGMAIGGGVFYLTNVVLTLGFAMAGEIGTATATAGFGAVSAVAGVDSLEGYVTGRQELRALQASDSE